MGHEALFEDIAYTYCSSPIVPIQQIPTRSIHQLYPAAPNSTSFGLEGVARGGAGRQKSRPGEDVSNRLMRLILDWSWQYFIAIGDGIAMCPL